MWGDVEEVVIIKLPAVKNTKRKKYSTREPKTQGHS